MFLVMFGLMFLGVPIAVSIYIAMLVLIGMNPVTTTNFIAQTLYGGVASFTNLALPFFMICGTIMETGGLSKRLVRFANSLVGGITGSLGMVTVIACMFFGAVSGSAPATVAAIGSIMIPMMVSNGYNKYYATGLTCCAGGLGVIVPPSYPMVLYGVTCNVSVGKLFIAGLGPAFVVGGLLMLINYVMCKRWGIKGDTKLELKNIASSFWDAKWALMVPVIVLGGIYGGIMTPTEAAAIAAFYGLIVGLFLYKEMDFKCLINSCIESCETSAVIIVLMAMATLFGNIMTIEDVPGTVARAILSFSENKIVILMLINVLLLIVGTFMEALAAIVILVPILLPIVTGVGVSPLHFGVIIVVNLAIGFITPPVGVNLFVASGVAKAKLENIAGQALPMIALMLIVLLICTYIPEVPLILVGGPH